jgi:hypothetical protein
MKCYHCNSFCCPGIDGLTNHRWFPLYTLVFFSLLVCSIATGIAADRPDWIDNPQLGAVGSAGTNIRGQNAQEELAVSRARIRLAARLGVKVSAIQQIVEVVENESGSVSSIRESTQTISNKTVKAYVRARWHDLTRDVVYVWMFPVE